MIRKIDFQKWASVAVCLGAALLFLRFFAARILSALLPFLLAAALSLLVAPLARKLSRPLHLRESVCAVILFFFCVAVALVLGGFAASRLLREAQGLIARLLADVGSPSSLLSDAVDALRLPDGEESELFRAQLKTMLTDLARNLLGWLSSQLPVRAARVVAGIPAGVMFSVVTVLAGVQFCIGGEGLRKKLFALLPAGWRSKIAGHRDGFLTLARRYLRAYALLFALTFSLLFFGFLILGLDYAAGRAFLVALVDILPVLGVGTVLIPWAAVELLCHRFYIGFGLLILCLAVTVVRQAVEPHLIGKSLGVHPLLSLAASYVGWRLFGIAGLLLGPLLVPFFKHLFFPRDASR